MIQWGLAMMRRIASIGALTLVLMLLAAPHGTAGSDPVAFINALVTQGIQLADANVQQAQRTAELRDLFQRDFDVPEIGRFVLGRYWRDITPDQQKEFLLLFQNCMVASYSQRLGEYGDVPFHTLRFRADGDETIVTTEFALASGGPVQIDWHVIDESGQYKIIDVAIDGVSMKMSLRGEFADIIQRNHGRADSILAVLRQQLTPAGGHNPYG
jgi:phospholipid transport system substrate-binding protein